MGFCRGFSSGLFPQWGFNVTLCLDLSSENNFRSEELIYNDEFSFDSQRFKYQTVKSDGSRILCFLVWQDFSQTTFHKRDKIAENGEVCHPFRTRISERFNRYFRNTSPSNTGQTSSAPLRKLHNSNKQRYCNK